MAPPTRTVDVPAGPVLVRLAGELDIAAVRSLHEELVGASAISPAVLLDMHEVTFIDAAVIGALVGAQQRLTAQGGGLRLVGASPWVCKVLQAAGVDEALPVHADPGTATTSLLEPPVRTS